MAILQVQQVFDASVGIYLQLASTALFFYDIFLTISDEISCVWKRKFSLTTYVYLINRYIMFVNLLTRLGGLVPRVHETVEHANAICTGTWRFSEACTMVMHLVMAAFCALRIYATNGKCRGLPALIIAAGCVGPGVTLYYDTTLLITAQSGPFPGCKQTSSFGTSVGEKIFMTVGSVFILFIECLSLILTWAKTNKMMLTMQQLRVFSPISVALWQDGAVYSCVILTLAGLNFLSITRPSFADIPALTDVLFSVALSRFILRLRMLVSAHASAASTLPISTVRFTRPLSDDGDDEDDGVCWAREAGAV